MKQVSAQVIQSMFNHLTTSYTADEAREILAQKYPDQDWGQIELVVDPSKYGVTTVEMGKVVKRTKSSKADLVEAVKAKTKKVAKPKESKNESKADIARKLYNESDDKSRGTMIAVFQEKLGMSKAAASTYYYNIKG